METIQPGQLDLISDCPDHLKEEALQAVEAAERLRGELESALRGVRLRGVDGTCCALQFPRWVAELNEPGQWSAIMQGPDGRQWDIAALWILSQEQEGQIKALKAIWGAGAVRSFLQA